MDRNIPPVSVVAIGAGNRMRTYMRYVAAHPDKVRLVAVADPDTTRREVLRKQFGLPRKAAFDSYEALFASNIRMQAAFVATPDNEHVRPTLMALDRGCHVLLEKPIAQHYDECEAIAAKSDSKGKLVSVCHVMRYHPMFIHIKKLVESGRYGRIITINHSEDVGIDRTTHSYVRGTLNNEARSNPMLLDKCCHDVDFLLWISGAHCKVLSSLGSRLWFREENAPAGSADRCVNCGIESECPYSAIDLYRTRREWTRNFIAGPTDTVEAMVERQLASGPFGRCVYHCDNDVVDNQVLTMQMTDGTLVTLRMNVFTQCDRRTIDIGMADGQITCDGYTVSARHFRTHRTETIDFSPLSKIGFHGGADVAIVEDFIDSIISGRKPRTEIHTALEAHRIIFEAERSRHSGFTVTM